MLEIIQKHRKLFIFEGIMFIVLGCLAIALPGIFSLGVELLVGGLFIASGLVQGYRTFTIGNVAGFFLSAAMTLLYLVIGVMLLAHPITGILTLTILLTFFFIIEGLAQMIVGFHYRPHRAWGWRVFSGLVSLALAFIIWQGWPMAAVWVIGLLVGINLLFVGFTQLFVALGAGRK